MSDEKIDVYDENLKSIGTMLRSDAHHQGAWHRSIHCWVYRSGDPGYVLFQKRGRNKTLFPNALDITAAGHYLAGEGPSEGVRELMEEIGLSVTVEDLIPLGIKVDLAKIGDITNREFCDVYLYENNILPSEYRIDHTEVEGLVEISIRDGLALFGGHSSRILARGVEWDDEHKKWCDIEINVTHDDFIPRIDPYYKKIFIIADLANKGYEYVSI